MSALSLFRPRSSILWPGPLTKLSNDRLVKNCSSSPSHKPFFISTPIFYVNSEPHIGHLHSLLVADVLSRFRRLVNPAEVPLFSTGTDEHGIKVQTAARLRNQPAKDFCDVISQSFIKLAHSFNCDYSHFIRTSDEGHSRVVEEVWRRLSTSGLIYKAKYEGWYCVSDESFIPAVVEQEIDGRVIKVSPESGHPVEWQSEENYMFRLSRFKDQLTDWIESKPICPPKFQKYAQSMIDHMDWNDLSISRPAQRLTWGIPVPGDESHTIYVWLDALVNYLTVAQFPSGERMSYWPPDVQVIGKDIIKFHAIYWPAFLLALGLPLPRKLLVHSHWTVNSVKMSKSLGNVVKPHDLEAEFSADGVRYYLMRAASLVDDANFSHIMMRRTVNSELADTLGNLLGRTCAKAINLAQEYPAYDPKATISSGRMAGDIQKALARLPTLAFDNYQNAHFNSVADEVMSLLRMANLFFHLQAPWKMVDHTVHPDEVMRTIFTCFEVLRVTSIVLSPIMPTICKGILDKLNVSLPQRTWQYAQRQFEPGQGSWPISPDPFVVFSKFKRETK